MRNGLVTLVLVVGTAALLYLFLFQDNAPDPIAYSGSDDSFLTMVANGEVAAVNTRGEALEIDRPSASRDSDIGGLFLSAGPAMPRHGTLGA